MMCAALANAEDRADLPPGPVGLTRRRKAVEPFERLWALACVAAREEGDRMAADGLRGIISAQRAWNGFRGDKVNPDFPFLKYQERTGAIGVYWMALVAGHLIDADTGQLLQEGRRLAREFDGPPLTEKSLLRLTDPLNSALATLPRADLLDWARRCHLAAAGQAEKQLLRELLVGHARRGCVAQALQALGNELPASWDVPAWRRLRETLARDSEACRHEMPVVIEVICGLEAFHEAALSVFQTLLWWGTEFTGHTVANLAQDPLLRSAVDRTRQTARDLQILFQTCESRDARKALQTLQEWARQLQECRTARDLLEAVYTRHCKVQEGKLDGGVPKRAWLSVTQTGQVLAPAAQFQRMQRPPTPEGEYLTHPYRLEAFIEMLRENDFFPSTAA
jgi:hypothetical protein